MARPDSPLYFESFNSEYESKPNYHNYENFKISYSGINDEEYQKFLKVRHSYSGKWYLKAKVDDMHGSIFSASPDFSLAISASADLKMNSGVAVKLKEKYNCVEIFKEQNVETGGLAFVKHKDTERYIYYLVVMPAYDVCPTYYTIWMCMQKLKENVLKYQVKRIAMSHIGCGITSGLTWDLVKPMVEYVFKDVSIVINAYEGKSSCIQNHDIENCYCFGHSLMPPEFDDSNTQSFNCKQDDMVRENQYYKYNKQEQKSNNYKYYDQAEKENFSGRSRLLGKYNFWDYNNQTGDSYKHGTQGEHSAYNTFNTQIVTQCSILGEANHHGTQKEDVYHKYCIRVGNDIYVKYSTEDAANDYYGALY